MGLNFYPIKTNDGSTGLFNTEVDDIYHSSYGAYTEALTKFIIPSGLTEKLKAKKTIRILDICFGMGYNSKCAIEKILQNNFEGEVFIDALENDFYVVAFSLICKNELFDFDIWDFLDFSIFQNHKILDFIFKILEDDKFADFLDSQKADFFKNNKKVLYKSIGDDLKSSNLHNIYYKYLSYRNIQKVNTPQNNPKISLFMHLIDAREAVVSLSGNYDFIFLDAFTPAKLPTLWTVEFFARLKDLSSPDGNITTYSNSAAVRNGMIEAGLFIGKTEQGTIAFQNPCSEIIPLDEKSLGLLQTKAGIPFYDLNLNLSGKEILRQREKMIKESDRQSSSQFLKKYQNKKIRL